MRRAARVDDNHREIVQTLRNMGFCVLDLSAVGSGCPDILVGSPHGNWLIEIKDGSKPPSRQKKTPDQQRFWGLWSGPIDLLRSVDEAIKWGQNVRRRGTSRKAFPQHSE